MKRLIAISDIHGCYDTLFELLIRRINLKKTDSLILLGDYIDRGEKSKEVIDFIIDLQRKKFDITPLLGNHEAMLIEAFNNNEMSPLWFMNSGMTTLGSFQLNNINNFESKYIEFFRSLNYFAEAGKFIFVHAGFNDDIPDPYSDTDSMIWHCRPSYENPFFAGKTIIHGHRPKTIEFVKKKIAENSNLIPIDTGCIYNDEEGYGNLSALIVNNLELVSVPLI
jgi:serine/threonine protein phosphatase 1